VQDAPWAIIVEASGAVSERRLQDQNPGTALPDTVSVLSSVVAGGKRTVVLSRAMRGTPFSFDSQVRLRCSALRLLLQASAPPPLSGRWRMRYLLAVVPAFLIVLVPTLMR
jgi:hypothetical protein